MSFEKQPEQPNKPSNSPEEAVELMTFTEATEALVNRATKIQEELKAERAIAAEIRSMGGAISKEAASKISSLEDSFKALMEIHERVIEPQRKEWATAFMQGEVLLIEKPANFDALMASDEYETIDDSELIDFQTEPALLTKETQLKAQAEAVEFEINQLTDELRVIESQGNEWQTRGFQDPLKIIQQMLPIQQNLQAYYNYLAELRQELSDLELNLGLVRRLQDREQNASV